MNTYPFISILLIIMWAYAAISKLIELEQFKQALASQVFPKWMGKILVWVLPIIEPGIVALLLFKNTQIIGMYASFVMMLLFTLYVGGAVYNIYERHPCACGGLFARLGWKKHFRVNVFFTLLSMIGLVLLENVVL